MLVPFDPQKAPQPSTPVSLPGQFVDSPLPTRDLSRALRLPPKKPVGLSFIREKLWCQTAPFKHVASYTQLSRNLCFPERDALTEVPGPSAVNTMVASPEEAQGRQGWCFPSQHLPAAPPL